ncbi:ABC transporter permease [Bengtsoniella intestinalis]|uniref:ABC transporter permease n=1 Tax=Bengtsoniella intestinalis TaxID=3073143 RepID=UPI00391EFB6D
MNITQAIKMAWKSISGNKGRSFLTMLGIIIGISSVMTIVSIANGMNQQIVAQFDAIGRNRITVSVYSYGSQSGANSNKTFEQMYAYVNQLGDLVEGITPTTTFYGSLAYGTKNSQNMSYEWTQDGVVGDMPPTVYFGSDQYGVANNFTIEKGRDIAYLDVQNYNQVIVLGANAAKTYFGTGNPIGQDMQLNGESFTVIGVYKAKDETNIWYDNIAVIPYSATRLFGQTAPTDFLVKATSTEAATEVTSRLTGFLAGIVPQGTGDYWVQSEDQWMEGSGDMYTQMGMVLGGIAAISLLVGGIGIMNIMLVTVTERTREIGIRRAIGAKRKSIIVQFLIEAGMICGIGGIFGVALGMAGGYALGQMMLQIAVYPDVKITLCALGLSVALGMIFGMYPAMKASKLQPVEALRAD